MVVGGTSVRATFSWITVNDVLDVLAQHAAGAGDREVTPVPLDSEGDRREGSPAHLVGQPDPEQNAVPWARKWDQLCDFEALEVRNSKASVVDPALLTLRPFDADR